MIRIDTRSGSWRREGAASDDVLQLLATGDICPAYGTRLDEVFAKGPKAAEKLYEAIAPDLSEKDLSVTNLELVLSEAGEPILKDGPNLRGPAEAIGGFTVGGFDVANMANNHVLDFGPEAFRETVRLVRSRGMEVLGAGENLAEAWMPLVVRRGDRRIGLLAFAENEFSNATRTTPGASSLRPGPNAATIRAAREQCDLLVVFVHGGNEYCPVASPRMVQTYRGFVDAGADAVIGHHAHTVQGMELYRDVPIVYNTGNFLFWHDPAHVDPMWWKEFFVRLSFDGRRCVRLDVHPVRMDPKTLALQPLAGEAREQFLARLNRLSEILADPDLHERFWWTYCLERLPHFERRLQETIAGMQRDDLRAKAAAHLRNLFTCEAHWEAISTALELVRQGRKAEEFGVQEELAALMRP